MTTQLYTVTDKAGPKVAGRRVQPGDTLELTENAARSELLAGSIVATTASGETGSNEAAPEVTATPVSEAATETVVETAKKKR